MSLRDRLIRDIREDGPLTIADYMTRCLHDPLDGYYADHPALGSAGDFITAPLVSQMFGEILGAWAYEVWRRLGSPSRIRLVEFGPGTGCVDERCPAGGENRSRFRGRMRDLAGGDQPPVAPGPGGRAPHVALD